MEEKKVEDAHSLEKIIDVPDGGYGWLVVLASFCFNLASAGSISAYSIYLAHYLNTNLYGGASKLDYAAIGGLELGAGFVLAPLIGRISNEFGIKITTSIGTLFLFLGILLSAFIKKLWQLYITQGLLVGLGYGFVFVPSYGVLPQWFRKRRSFAVSVAASGSGVGGVVFSLALQKIIQSINLKWALIIQSIVSTAVCTVGVILVRTRNEEIGAKKKIFDLSVLQYPIFCLFLLQSFLAVQGYVVLLFNLADYTRTLGYSSSQAAIVSCMVSVGFVVGRPIVGRFSDWFGSVTLNILVNFLVALLCFAMWLPIRKYAAAIAFALLQGLICGSIWVCIAPMTTRIVGLRSLGTSLNIVWTVIGVSAAVSPVIAIQLRGAGGNGVAHSPKQYVHPALYCGFTYFGAGIIGFVIRTYLLARDELAERNQSHEDNDEIHLRASPTELIRKLFAKSPTRKI